MLGNRDTATFQRLYAKVAHLWACTFYSDRWDAFAKVLPAWQHILGKKDTLHVERDNSNTRHFLARFTRRTKVVSKCPLMVVLSIRLCRSLQDPDIFSIFQNKALSIYR